MKITYATGKNSKQDDKPNEDIAFCDVEGKIFILLDGVSRDNENGKYPNPSPAVEVVNILKEKIYLELSQKAYIRTEVEDKLKDVIRKANTEIRKYNEKEKLSFPAGAVGIVAIIIDDIFYYSYIGDCYGRTINENGIYFFTECQTKKISEHKKEFSTTEIREKICNNKTHPYSYGVLNGDVRALSFLNTGKIRLTDVGYILLSSDGMEYFLDSCSIEIIKELDANELLQRAIKYNNLKKDDRSVIKIDLEESYK